MENEITLGTVVFTNFSNELFVVVAIRTDRDGINEYLLDEISGWWFENELNVVAYV